MKLIVNGEVLDHQGAGELSDVLRVIGAHPERVAVMVNDDVVPRAAWPALTLADGDRVEVILFCGGGSGYDC